MLLVVTALASIFISVNVYGGSGLPEDSSSKKDPHFHVDEITVCCDEIHSCGPE